MREDNKNTIADNNTTIDVLDNIRQPSLSDDDDDDDDDDADDDDNIVEDDLFSSSQIPLRRQHWNKFFQSATSK